MSYVYFIHKINSDIIYKYPKIYAVLDKISNILFIIGLIESFYIVFMWPKPSSGSSANPGNGPGGYGGQEPTPGDQKSIPKRGDNKGYRQIYVRGNKDPYIHLSYKFQYPSLQRSGDEGFFYEKVSLASPFPPGDSRPWPVEPKPDLYGPDWKLQKGPEGDNTPYVNIHDKFFFTKGEPKDGYIFNWGQGIPWKGDRVIINIKSYTDDWSATVTGKDRREEYSRYWKYDGKSKQWEWQKITYKDPKPVSSISGTKRANDSPFENSNKKPLYRY